MSLQAADAEAGALAVAPRVTLLDIECAIAEEHYCTATDIAPQSKYDVGLLTICLLVMKNGFMVIGKSAPASPANFNAEFGRKLAYEDAVRQLWPLMGFELRERLSRTVRVS